MACPAAMESRLDRTANLRYRRDLLPSPSSEAVSVRRRPDRKAQGGFPAAEPPSCPGRAVPGPPFPCVPVPGCWGPAQVSCGPGAGLGPELVRQVCPSVRRGAGLVMRGGRSHLGTTSADHGSVYCWSGNTFSEGSREGGDRLEKEERHGLRAGGVCSFWGWRTWRGPGASTPERPG